MTFLVTSFFSIVLLFGIITGHLILVFFLWFYATDGTGMEVISAFTDLSETILWIGIVIAMIMDIWVVINMRKGHQKAKKR